MKLTEEQNSILEKYMEGILAWNEKVNLTNITDPAEFRIKHNADSLMCVDFPEFLEAETVIDVGTGGGFPGIPLAILFPNARFTLCDSIRKKTVVASEVARELGLENVSVVNARAETLPGKFDYVVSRAVASLSDFYPWVKGRYTKGILYLKGGEINEEISEMMARFKMRKGSVSTWPVTSWLQDNYFEGKFVINIL